MFRKACKVLPTNKANDRTSLARWASALAITNWPTQLRGMIFTDIVLVIFFHGGKYIATWSFELGYSLATNQASPRRARASRDLAL